MTALLREVDLDVRDARPQVALPECAGIDFRNVNEERVRITVSVVNRSLENSAPTVAALQWSPLAPSFPGGH